jgi:hypothetical protein
LGKSDKLVYKLWSLKNVGILHDKFHRRNSVEVALPFAEGHHEVHVQQAKEGISVSSPICSEHDGFCLLLPSYYRKKDVSFGGKVVLCFGAKFNRTTARHKSFAHPAHHT